MCERGTILVNFEYYKIFYFVAKNRNMTRAAEQLYMTQPAITKTIQKLESELGKKLFIRSQKGVELTEDAEALFERIAPACEQILEVENQAGKDAGDGIDVLRISTTDLVMERFLMDVIVRFQQKHPKLSISTDRTSIEQKLQNLHNALCDIIIDFDSLLYGEKTVEMEMEVLETLQDGAFVSEKFQELIGKELTLDDLQGHTLILPSNDSGIKVFYENLLNLSGAKLNLTYASGHTLRLKYAKMGLGILIAPPEAVQAQLSQKILFPLHLKQPLMRRNIVMITAPRENKPSIIKEFWNEMICYFKEESL